MDGLDRIAERKHARTPGARDRNIGNDDLKCTYRCVVLPDEMHKQEDRSNVRVSMHLQVRGAP